jgi:hypothetical protein
VANDGTRPEHGLETEHLGPHGSVAQDPDAAGVGGHHPADRGRVTGAEVDAEGPPRRAGVLVEGGQRDAGAGRDLTGEAVDRLQPVEAPGGQHDGAVAGAGGHAAGHQSGVAPLRDDGDAALGAPADDGGHLFDRTRSHHGRRLAPEAARPVDLVARADVGVDDDVVGADQRRQVTRERRGHAPVWRRPVRPRRP